MSKPGKEHWIVVKWVFNYFPGTTNHIIYYQGRDGPYKVLDVHGFVDVDLARDVDHRGSTTRYVFNLFGGVITWMSKKQAIVALTNTKIEYMETTHESKEVVWL